MAGSTLQDIRVYNAFHLSDRAGCACPDDLDSPGAAFLTSVRDAVVEVLEETSLDDLDRIDDNGAIHQIADDAPDVYTYTRWREFVDLAAWQEDIEEYGPIEDLEKAAGIALYMIAERLCHVLIGEYREHLEQAAEDDPVVNAILDTLAQ